MARKFKIIRNAIRCKNCGEIIESKSTHDFVECKCFRQSHGLTGCCVDGGLSYLKRCGDPEMWEDLSETRPLTPQEQAEWERKMDEYNMFENRRYRLW